MVIFEKSPLLRLFCEISRIRYAVPLNQTHMWLEIIKENQDEINETPISQA